MSFYRNKSLAMLLSIIMAGGTGAIVAENSSYMVYAEASLPAPTNIEAVINDKTVTFNWDSVDGADAYRVYQYDEASQGYKALKTVTGESATISGLENGSACRFKIATLTRYKSRYTLNSISDPVKATPSKGNKKEVQRKQAEVKSEEQQEKPKPEVKKTPAPKIENMGKSFTWHDIGLSELGKESFKIFEGYRSSIVVKGYKIKVLSSKADVGEYKATYEVSWQGTPMYTLTEEYKAVYINEGTDEEDDWTITGEVSMTLKEIGEI